MKKLVLCAVAVAAMASCSQNEVTQVSSQKAIGFNDAQWGNSIIGRATTNLETSVKLGVFAYQTAGSPTGLYIDNAELSHSGTAWTLNKTHYWPLENPEMKFYAYGPKTDGNGISTVTCTTGGTPTFDYTVTGAPGAQTDVIVDLAGQTASTGNVTFALSHVLTQVKFKAQLSASPNIDLSVKINSITVKAPESAKFAIASGIASWTGYAATNTDYTVLATETEVTAANGSATDIGATLNMIPGSTAAEIVVKVTVYEKIKSTKVAEKDITIKCDGTASPNVATWGAGEQVTYTLTLDPTANSIGFEQPTVSDWTPGTGNIE